MHQAAHYHNLGPKLGASLLTRHIGWKNRKKKKREITCTPQFLAHFPEMKVGLSNH
jgi:hypothetical protein